MHRKIFAIGGLIGIGILGRLVPHAPNATAITGITVAARRYVGGVWVYVIPLLAMVVSDLVIGFYDWRILISVYGSFFLIAALSTLMTSFKSRWALLAMAAVGSIIFFLVTNFAVWMFSPWYAKSLSGLLYCYTLGLPFLRNMLCADLVYTFVLLGMFEHSRLVATKKKLLAA